MEQVTEEISQKAYEIQTRISELEALSGVDLKNEMSNLKTALMQNPSACLLLKEEDIGILVASLRKTLGLAVASAASKPTRATKTESKKLSVEELNALLEQDL